MGKVASGDSVRRGLERIGADEGISWLQGHLDDTIRPLLSEPWVAAALRRIAGFFRALTRSAEQLTAEDRWRRILAEALKKYLHGREPGRPHGLPPPRAAPAC